MNAHEELVETTGMAILHELRDRRGFRQEIDLIDDEVLFELRTALGRVVIVAVAEATKEATEKMVSAALRDIADPDDIDLDGPLARDWSAMHRASALWPFPLLPNRRAEAAEAERDALRAENERLKEENDAYRMDGDPAALALAAAVEAERAACETIARATARQRIAASKASSNPSIDEWMAVTAEQIADAIAARRKA